MQFNRTRVKQYLSNANFEDLFIEELGWDLPETPPRTLELDGETYVVEPIAQKRSVYAFEVRAPQIPPSSVRRKVEAEVTKAFREHFLIFTQAEGQRQIWQWVHREPGRTAGRTHEYRAHQSGESLVQKLERLAVSIDEEEDLTLVDVVGNVRAAFDLEPVTRKFYQEFNKQHKAFRKFLQGIPDQEMESWYVSVMLNRLMFIYFIQKKGFLNRDANYLRRLLQTSKAQGEDRYYRTFLCPLFFEGFAKPENQRDPVQRQRLGAIPYLNGGIFQQHQVERLYGQDIHIPDQAFERIYDFFDGYQWHLDDRPLRRDNEINPDVLGYIFEQYINQKQMGAYYTKEDITEYIAKNTILPFLFDRVEKACPAAFQGEESVWALLADNPDRYIYPALRQGVDEKLPPAIEAGIHDVSRREQWNTPTPDPYALPTEIWRETVARRQRCAEIRFKLFEGEVGQINDLITLNLDVRQFAQDVIERSENPELVRAFWKSINDVSVLDPTCGSGAFLFAALNILKPLYEGCLDRMEQFVAADDAGGSGRKYPDFREELAEIRSHPNRDYFILKRILVNNLYGVDIMEEATEIAKLRLFLKLVAQVDDKDRLEPLPDIDFNIRAGNALVGFASFEEMEQVVRGNRLLLLPEDEELLAEIKEKAEDADRLFALFRKQQTRREWQEDAVETKEKLRRRLEELENRLNRLLARQYGIDPDKLEYEKWLKNHEPFHWVVDFYGIVTSGGFSIVIGNPPYVQMHKIKEYRLLGYKTQDCGNLYAPCVERGTDLLAERGYFGMIVPLSSFSTSRMEAYQDYLWNYYGRLYLSYYSGDAHPSVMFNGVKYRLSIVLGIPSNAPIREAEVYVTDYLRWYSDERSILFPAKISYHPCKYRTGFLRFAKTGSRLAVAVLDKILDQNKRLGTYILRSGPAHLTYHRSPVFWIRSMDFEPYFKSPTRTRSLDHIRDLYFQNQSQAHRAGAIINSTCFYFWFTVQGNCRNLTNEDVHKFPVGDIASADLGETELAFSKLMKDLRRRSKIRIYNYSTGTVEYEEFYLSLSKPILDEIEQVLAKHYKFDDEELDYIINYDIKYRMGDELFDDEEDE